MRTLRLQGILVGAAACLFLTASAGARSADLSAAVGIDNFARVNATYFRGSSPKVTTMPLWRRLASRR